MTAVLRWAVRVHKWFALVVGIQIFIWIIGGVVMSILPIERVRGEHHMAPAPTGVLDPSSMVSMTEAVQAAGASGQVTAIALQTWQGRSVYNVARADGGSALVDARTGARITPVDRETAIEIARADYAGEPEIAAVEFFPEPTGEYRVAGGAWRIDFADGEGTRIYVAPDTGLVMARRNDVWRVYDFFWMLHIMDYRDRENFNNWLVRIAAMLGLVTALAGLVVLFVKMSRSIRLAQSRKLR